MIAGTVGFPQGAQSALREAGEDFRMKKEEIC